MEVRSPQKEQPSLSLKPLPSFKSVQPRQRLFSSEEEIDTEPRMESDEASYSQFRDPCSDLNFPICSDFQSMTHPVDFRRQDDAQIQKKPNAADKSFRVQIENVLKDERELDALEEKLSKSMQGSEDWHKYNKQNDMKMLQEFGRTLNAERSEKLNCLKIQHEKDLKDLEVRLSKKTQDLGEVYRTSLKSLRAEHLIHLAEQKSKARVDLEEVKHRMGHELHKKESELADVKIILMQKEFKINELERQVRRLSDEKQNVEAVVHSDIRQKMGYLEKGCAELSVVKTEEVPALEQRYAEQLRTLKKGYEKQEKIEAEHKEGLAACEDMMKTTISNASEEQMEHVVLTTHEMGALLYGKLAELISSVEEKNSRSDSSRNLEIEFQNLLQKNDKELKVRVLEISNLERQIFALSIRVADLESMLVTKEEEASELAARCKSELLEANKMKSDLEFAVEQLKIQKQKDEDEIEYLQNYCRSLCLEKDSLEYSLQQKELVEKNKPVACNCLRLCKERNTLKLKVTELKSQVDSLNLKLEHEQTNRKTVELKMKDEIDCIPAGKQAEEHKAVKSNAVEQRMKVDKLGIPSSHICYRSTESRDRTTGNRAYERCVGEEK